MGAVLCQPDSTIQSSGQRLQEQMSPATASLHLLPLGRALADGGIHRRLDESQGDLRPGPVALAIVDEARLVAGDINFELPHGRPEFAQIGIATVERVEIEHQIIDSCRRGATEEDLAHDASLHLSDKNALSNPGANIRPLKR
jgi:hypothetical protein